MIAHARPVLLWARMQRARDGTLSNGTPDWRPARRSVGSGVGAANRLKFQLPTDDRGKTIDDGSSSSTLSTPFSFGNCLMPAVELDAARLVGGSEADRSRVLERVHEYLEANASFDWGQLQDIWSGAPEAVFFNLNGHTYKGRAHWTRLWQFYENNVASSYWTPFDIGGVVSD